MHGLHIYTVRRMNKWVRARQPSMWTFEVILSRTRSLQYTQILRERKKHEIRWSESMDERMRERGHQWELIVIWIFQCMCADSTQHTCSRALSFSLSVVTTQWIENDRERQRESSSMLTRTDRTATGKLHSFSFCG